jgi:type II secretory pathway pseudopilin PulG
MKNTDKQNRREISGTTLTELLVVLVIISLLSTIAVPVYVGHAERARRAVAIQETRELAHAMETVGALHGFYVPLQVLDDLPGGTQATEVQDPQSSDAIGDESEISLVEFTNTLLALNNNQPRISDDDIRVNRMVNEWQGPFINFQRFYIVDSSNPDLTGNNGRFDFPLDPWGRPYRLYSPLGHVGSGAVTPTVNGRIASPSNFSDGVVTTAGSFVDRFAVVSFGPDGEPPANPTIISPNDDEIFYTFGTINLERTETSFAPLP